MSSNSGLFGPSAPVIRLSPEEKQLYGQLFRQADPDFTQVVTGDAALQLFVKSGLSQAVLGEIWQLADPDDKGFLDQTGFSVALRIIGHVQKGQLPASNLADIRTFSFMLNVFFFLLVSFSNLFYFYSWSIASFRKR